MKTPTTNRLLCTAGLLLALLPAAPAPALAAGPADQAAPASVRLLPLQLHGNALRRAPGKIDVDTLDTLAASTRWTLYDPYEKRDVSYGGITLKALVAAVAPQAQQVRMRAINDYITVFERHEWETLPILVATRRDDARMPVAGKGPVRVVYLQTRDNELAMQVHAPKWIWQVTDVEFIAR